MNSPLRPHAMPARRVVVDLQVAVLAETQQRFPATERIMNRVVRHK